MKIGVVTDVRDNALVIPQRAVIEMQGVYQVYVLGGITPPAPLSP